MDSYDHLMPDDLKQSATIMAAFLYNSAMLDEKIQEKYYQNHFRLMPLQDRKTK